MPKAETKRIGQLIKVAIEILLVQWPMTIRQLFYQLVSGQHIANKRGDYQRVSRIMKKVREDGRCAWEWIVDRSRPVYAPNVFRDPQVRRSDQARLSKGLLGDAT